MNRIGEIFSSIGGIAKSSELKANGLTSRKIAKLIEDGVIARVKKGYYEYLEEFIKDEEYIVKIFPDAIICLGSALLIHEYTDRVPSSWNLAVDRDTGKTKFKIEYPRVTPIYVSKEYLNIGVEIRESNGVKMKVYNKERTICDCLRYQNKMDTEIFRKAILAYLDDRDRYIGRLIQYGKLFKVKKKIDTYIGLWL